MKNVNPETYKAVLLEMRSRLMRVLPDIEEAIREDIHPPGEVSSVPSHPADHALTIDDNLAVAENEAEILEQVEQALERIEAGKFGVCQRCGAAIDPQRLRAIPYAPHCVRCAGELENEGPE
jgi:RNA polymerase-binding transcription factor DksA